MQDNGFSVPEVVGHELHPVPNTLVVVAVGSLHISNVGPRLLHPVVDFVLVGCHTHKVQEF